MTAQKPDLKLDPVTSIEERELLEVVRELNSGDHRGIPASWANDPNNMTPLQTDRTSSSRNADPFQETHRDSEEAGEQSRLSTQHHREAQTAQPSEPSEPITTAPIRKGKGAYQHIKIAALNMKGHGSLKATKIINGSRYLVE